MSLRKVATFSKMAEATAAAARTKTRRVRYSGHVGEKEFREAIAIALKYLGERYQKEVDPKYKIPSVDDFLKFMAYTKASLTPSRKIRVLSKSFKGPVATAVAAPTKRQEGGGTFEVIITLLMFAFGGNIVSLVSGRTPSHTIMTILNFILFAIMLRDIVTAITEEPYPFTIDSLSERVMAGLAVPSWSDPLRYGLYMLFPTPMTIAYYDGLVELYSQVYTSIYIFLVPQHISVFDLGGIIHTGIEGGFIIGSLTLGDPSSFSILAKAIKLIITNTHIFNITFALPVAHVLQKLHVPGADEYLRELVEKIRKPVVWLLGPAEGGPPAIGPVGGAGI